MLDTPWFRTLRKAASVAVAGAVCALGVQLVIGSVPTESRICVGAMQTTACVPPA